MNVSTNHHHHHQWATAAAVAPEVGTAHLNKLWIKHPDSTIETQNKEGEHPNNEHLWHVSHWDRTTYTGMRAFCFTARPLLHSRPLLSLEPRATQGAAPTDVTSLQKYGWDSRLLIFTIFNCTKIFHTWTSGTNFSWTKECEWNVLEG